MLRAPPKWILVAAAVTACSACSLFVDTSGLDTQTGDGGDASSDTNLDGTLDQVTSDVTPDVSEAAPGDAGCPDGGGPTMVQLSWGFCIDSTEVTVGQYQQFLTAIGSGYNPVSPARCGWNSIYSMPTDAYCQMPNDFPASCINWCQAYAFCAWAGKHLCGGKTGGAVDYGSANDPGMSAWPSACTSNGSNNFSYGNTYMPYCNTPDPADDPDSSSPNPVAVASEPQCQGPPNVFDLIGNASEWIDSCELDDASVGDTDTCHHLGGASSSYVACLDDDNDMRSFGFADGYPIGFRCCSP